MVPTAQQLSWIEPFLFCASIGMEERKYPGLRTPVVVGRQFWPPIVSRSIWPELILGAGPLPSIAPWQWRRAARNNGVAPGDDDGRCPHTFAFHQPVESSGVGRVQAEAAVRCGSAKPVDLIAAISTVRPVIATVCRRRKVGRFSCLRRTPSYSSRASLIEIKAANGAPARLHASLTFRLFTSGAPAAWRCSPRCAAPRRG
jgi:hypothetical protein